MTIAEFEDGSWRIEGTAEELRELAESLEEAAETGQADCALLNTEGITDLLILRS